MGTQLSLPKKEAEPLIFGPCLLWPNGCMDQDATWYGGTVGLGPDNIVLDGDPAPPPKKRGDTAPPIFGPCLLWRNGWIDQDATWCGGRLRPRPHSVRWRPSSHLKRGTAPLFGPCLLWPNGWMDQDATWYKGRPRPGQHCVWCGSSSIPKGQSPPNFRPMCIVVKRSPISATVEHEHLFELIPRFVDMSMLPSGRLSHLILFIVPVWYYPHWPFQNSALYVPVIR